jgi:hypothetical protein
MITNVADEIDCLLDYPRDLTSDARRLLERASQALRAPLAAKCPHGCTVGVQVRYVAPGVVSYYSCVRCCSRWLP